MITYKYTDSNICVFTPSRQINQKLKQTSILILCHFVWSTKVKVLMNGINIFLTVIKKKRIKAKKKDLMNIFMFLEP